MKSNRFCLKVDRAQSGQGLIEYLIIVALMGVATIAIVRTMGEAVSRRFATITNALQGDAAVKKADVRDGAYKKKDMGDFFRGSRGANRGDSGDGEE